MKPPSERTLTAVERELRALAKGSQRAVGGGVYMRIDGDGRRRFQIRPRTGNRQTASTFDSWQEAHDKLQLLETGAGKSSHSPAEVVLVASFEIAPGQGGVVGPTHEQMRQMTFSQYREKIYWPAAVTRLDPVTLADYRSKLESDVEPIIGGFTIAQLTDSPTIVDHFKTELAKRKTYPATRKRGDKVVPHPQAGQVKKSACDAAIKAASSVMKDAQERHVSARNPFQGIARFNRQKTASGGSKNASYRRVKESDILHPRMVARIGSGMRGTWLQVEQRRLIVDLVAYGWRPSDSIATEHQHWRNKDGARKRAKIEQAVKDVHGHLMLGEPKTGKRDLELFDAIAWQFERVYQAQGCPSLQQFVVTNRQGGLLDWGNFRDDNWYQALQRAGIIETIDAYAVDAFDPYLLRHIGVSTMTHATRPEGGTYSVMEVAKHYGHTPETLLRVYADIPEDMHGIAGMTMDEIIWAARREIYGSMPIDPDFDDRLYTIKQAAELIGIDAKSLGGKVNRRSIPATMEGGRYLISEFDLVWLGLLDPKHRRR